MDKQDEILSKLNVLLADEERTKRMKDEEIIRRNNFVDEEKRLKKMAIKTFLILSTIVVSTTIFTCIAIVIHFYLLVICIIVGVLGSSTTALLSALDRKSHGWESNHGDKYPKDGKGDMFSERMHTFFLFRPFLGIAAGLVVFFGVQQDYLECIQVTQDSKIIFYSLIAGLFIKTFLDKLKDLLEKLLGVFSK